MGIQKLQKLQKLQNKMFQKLGYVPHEYLHQSREKTRSSNTISKELRSISTLKNKEIKTLKKEIKEQVQKPVKVNRNKLQTWSKTVRKNNCYVCNSKNELTAHHVWPKSKYPELMYNSKNGASLCKTCHNNYHKKYPSIENCNPKTLDEFKEDKKNEFELQKLHQSRGYKVMKYLKIIK